MPLTPSTRLGHVEIVSAIGAGGMGEVYRARDVQLDRDVAVKVLPDAFAADPDRLMRFEREAKTLATLNHPHIAQIYGLELAVGAGGHPHELRRRDRPRPENRAAGVRARRLLGVAEGRIYLASEDGQVTVVRAGREWTVLGSSDLSEPVFATPALLASRVYVRTASALYAFGK